MNMLFPWTCEVDLVHMNYDYTEYLSIKSLEEYKNMTLSDMYGNTIH